MNKNIFERQSGITLVELLVTITIITIVIILSFNILYPSIKTNNEVQTNMNLNQEANVVINTIRSHYLKGENICYDQLHSDEYSLELLLSDKNITQGECFKLKTEDSLPDLPVKVTLKNKNDNSFTIETTISDQETYTMTLVQHSQPIGGNFYEYIKNNNVFVYGSHLGISGSTPVKGQGALVINNSNNTNLIFNGNNKVSVKNIYINKEGNKVIFDNSTKLGEKSLTEIIRIEGDVNLNNGGSQINGNMIYIKGDLNFNNSAVIHGKTVMIDGNVRFGNWSADIIAEELYISGGISRIHDGQAENAQDFQQASGVEIPEIVENSQPHLHEDKWYEDNDYIITSNSNLTDGIKIFSPNNFTVQDHHQNTENVIIISKGNITINNFGGSKLTGILFAPNGKVTFNGATFEGVVIARNGFETLSNPTITFRNVEDFITSEELIPFY